MQMLDVFTFQGERVEAIAISQRFDFSPKRNFGIETEPWMTANYRGFICEYSLDEAFTVQNLFLFSRNQYYPPVMGIEAELDPVYETIYESVGKSGLGPRQYNGINYNTGYSGAIVIGVEPVRKRREPEQYRQVLELRYRCGFLSETRDITELWREARREDGKCDAEYWWMEEKNNYFYLINFAFMGLEN